MSGPGPAGRPATLRLRLDSRAEAVRAALGALRGQLGATAHGAADPDTVELVLAELLNNVVRHACQGRPGHAIEVAARAIPGGLFLLIRDDGGAMPGGAPPGGPAADPAGLPEGGFGWGLIRVLARDIRYARRGGRNRIALVIPGA
jgi:serine/threonine-protein kinase RsbW